MNETTAYFDAERVRELLDAEDRLESKHVHVRCNADGRVWLFGDRTGRRVVAVACAGFDAGAFPVEFMPGQAVEAARAGMRFVAVTITRPAGSQGSRWREISIDPADLHP